MVLADKRVRRKHRFNFNLCNDAERFLHEWLSSLKAKRQYLPTIRRALLLWHDLVIKGSTRLLTEEAPDIVDRIRAEERARANRDIRLREEELAQQISEVQALAGLLKSIGEQTRTLPAQAQPRLIGSGRFDLEAIEDDDAGETTPAKSNGNTASNLLVSLSGLSKQQGGRKNGEAFNRSR